MRNNSINFLNYSEMITFKSKNNGIKNLAFNEKNFLKLHFNALSDDVYLDDFSKSIVIKNNDTIETKNACVNINKYIAKRFYYIFFKIRFNGKGFRIQSFKNKKIINFTFGHSHRYMMHLPKTKFKRINKYKYFFSVNNINILNEMKVNLRRVKPINKYTLRGLRISKTIIVKRKGRKSPNI